MPEHRERQRAAEHDRVEAAAGPRGRGRSWRDRLRGAARAAGPASGGAGRCELLPEALREELPGERRRGRSAVAAVLDEDDDDDLRVLQRSEAPRTRRGPRYLPFGSSPAPDVVVPDDLHRAGLARRRRAPGSREANAVPPGSFTTAHIPSLTIASLVASTAGCRPSSPRVVAQARAGDRVLRGEKRCGVGRRPPSTSPERARATCSGVTSTGPWPIATEMVSLGYQRARALRQAHASEGTRPALLDWQVDARRLAEAEARARSRRSGRCRGAGRGCRSRRRTKP